MRAGDQEPSLERQRGLRRAWLRSERTAPRLIARPIERFLQLEAGSAALLMAAAIAALVWANAAGDSYGDFWSTEIGFELGGFTLEDDLLHVVNDLLMAVFFYVVALEVKREVRFGSLRDPASAAVPVAAALGTMLGGAAAYVAVNIDGGELGGWAVPIATDIAFAIGALGLVGKRAPRELRIFLLTLAVVDDLATIAVIAFFFSEGIVFGWLAAAAGLTLLVVVLQRLHVRYMPVYVGVAAVLWVAVFESGIHATIAGVVLGFLTPAVAFHPRQRAGDAIAGRLAEVARAEDVEVSESTVWEVSRVAREGVSPLARMEAQLHPWSAYVILPLFALANAGVVVSGDTLGDALTSQVGLGILLGLVVGAPVIGLALAWAVVRFTPARMPEGLDWPSIGALAPLKGIGFTVAIFISVLAFDNDVAREQAKLAILLASALAGIIGVSALFLRHRITRPARAEPG